jgi:glucose/arabinose dehydrogenase
MLIAQKPFGQPQPRADRLAPISVPTRGRTVMLPKPDGVMPSAPAGFVVTSYAELQAPRMMVYAPNGDLFVSSPAANNITVLRDANQDGVFEARPQPPQKAAVAKFQTEALRKALRRRQGGLHDRLRRHAHPPS